METSWYCLPGEVRNRVYEWCLLLEDDKKQSVRHFPHGFRRCRSKQKNVADANFPSSYWGFTQACRQIRAEFTPWLLERRHVKTPLATLNEYLDVFHPVNPETRRRTGSIEPTRPKYSRVPISISGIEILDLLKRNHFDQNFRLVLRAEYSMISTYKRDELDILYRLSHDVDWSSELHRSCGIVSIVLLPYEVNTWNSHVVVPHFVTRPSFKHKSMVRLTCKPTHTADGSLKTTQEQRWCVVNWLFNESQLVYYQDLWIHVIINGFETMWRVNMPGSVIGQWEKFADGRSIVREHWLLRVTMLSAEGSVVSTIKELPSR